MENKPLDHFVQGKLISVSPDMDGRSLVLDLQGEKLSPTGYSNSEIRALLGIDENGNAEFIVVNQHGTLAQISSIAGGTGEGNIAYSFVGVDDFQGRAYFLEENATPISELYPVGAIQFIRDYLGDPADFASGEDTSRYVGRWYLDHNASGSAVAIDYLWFKGTGEGFVRGLGHIPASIAIAANDTQATAFSVPTGDVYIRSTGELAQNGLQTSFTTAFVSAGTAYSLTATSASIHFGTTDPILNFSTVSPAAQATTAKYLLRARVNLKYTGATFAAGRTVTLKFRRTNHTAADLTGGSTTVVTGIVTTVTQTFMIVAWEMLYTPTNPDETIAIFADVSVVPTAGSLDIIEASIVAIPIV